MTLLWYAFLYLIFFPFVLLQTTTTVINNGTTTLPTKSEIENSVIKPPHVTILGALRNDEQIEAFHNTTNDIDKYINVSSRSFILDENPLLTIAALCETAGQCNPKLIISSHILDDDGLTFAAIAYVADYYHIPVITIASRDNILSDEVSSIILIS